MNMSVAKSSLLNRPVPEDLARQLRDRGVHVADAFTTGQLDTKKELLVCLPSREAS